MGQHKTRAKKKSPEKVLLEHWTKKLDKATGSGKKCVSDFKAVFDGARHSSHFFANGVMTLSEARTEVSEKIFTGMPLTHAAYHFAMATGLLLGDYSYLEFFKYRWHETPTHRAYGPRGSCATCAKEV